ncbi:MAG: DUF1289 domain-containing protein [Gemmatimonadota bacterium]
MPLPSPCRSICRLGDDSVCDGCGRTLAEVAGWTGMSDAERRLIMERVREWEIRDYGSGHDHPRSS